MNQYNLRKNYTSNFKIGNSIIRGKLAFKTKNDVWLNTPTSVLVLISIDSSFHKPIDGDLKMSALIDTIRTHVKGKVTLLMADQAHLQTSSIKHENNVDTAFETNKQKASELAIRYQHLFHSCELVYWHFYIDRDFYYSDALKKIKDLYRKDRIFREMIALDVQSSYTASRRNEFINEALFSQKTTEDILAQCAAILVMAKKGYRFLFYPGKPFGSTEYINQKLLLPHHQVAWIDVFLTIEKKTIVVEEKT